MDLTCCMTDGDPWEARQHNLKSDSKEDHLLLPSGPSNNGKSPGHNQQK